MRTDLNGLRDELHAQVARGRDSTDGMFLVGYGVATVLDPAGRVVQRETFTNLITDAGDLYYATKMIQGVVPSSTAAPTALTGMKLGTGTTAASKAGAGAALVTYLTASNVAFDATFPKTVNLGAGLGVQAQYQATWGAGVATSATINEVVIVNDSATNATSTPANTVARAVLTTVNKASTDSLTIIWSHKALGA